jgi:hypothetical protein
MIIPLVDVIYNKFFLPLPICGRDIKHFVAFLIAHLECLFHLEHIDLLRANLTTCMDIMWQSGMFNGALALG